MENSTLAAVVILLAASVWLLGALLQWKNLRRQEEILAALERRSLDTPPEVLDRRLGWPAPQGPPSEQMTRVPRGPGALD
jgi:hypothetical protein